ncbi:MAG TPA: hypothetical protein VLI90_08925, partial [Tepidisphaeraceae bacterium]|nr:hypothetical protein [Tepidisphaeraceae bacterium]
MSGHAKRMVQSARRRRRGAIEAVAAAAATSIALSAPIASATSGYYVGPSNGNWNSAANWAATSGGAGGVGVPGDGDFAVLDSPANTTVNFDGSFSTGLSTFWIGSSGAANPTLNIAAGTVRYNNVADFYGMLLGKGGQGTISLSGTGALNVTGNEEVGWDNTGTFIQSGGTHTVDNSHAMLLGRFAAASGSYLLSGGSLNAGSEYVGYDGSGTFTQTGGTNTVYANLFIAGDALGSSGSYTISNGTLLADFIGVSGGVNDPGGTAALTVNSGGHVTLTATPLNTAVSVLRLFGGGTVTVNTGGLITGGSVWDDGTFNFNGGSATFASGANVGLTNTGVFNQTVAGTTLVNGGNLQVGSNTGANGTYTLAGAGTVVSVSLAEYIGNGGAGTFNQSGGSNSLALELRIGEQASGNGTYNLSAGSVTAGESEFIANLGVASFNQTGGTNNANGLRVASGVGSIASYSLGGTGSVSITGASAFENIGESGLGIFNQSAGTHSVSGAVAISQYAGSRGIYNLSGGTYSISSDLNIGGQGIGTNANLNISGGAISVTGTAGIGSSTGNATLSQSAGTSTVGQLIVGGSAGSAGVVLLSGGALNGGVVENIGSSGSAIFNQTGGTHNTSEIFLSANGTNNSAYLMSGGNLNVNVAGNPNNLYVGGSAGASFVQSGGAVTVGATLDLAHTAGEHGSYTLSGAGSLSAASEYIGDTGVGTFVQSGGTNTTQFIDLSAVNGSDASTYRLSGGTLLVNSATANVFIGDFASGSFIQSGGTFSQTNNGLYLGR